MSDTTTDAVVGLIPLAIGAGIIMRVIDGPRRPRPMPRRTKARPLPKRRQSEPSFLY